MSKKKKRDDYMAELNERQKHFIDRALEGLGRMDSLVANLLDLSRMDANMPLDMEDCDLREIVREAVDWYAEVASSRGIKVRMQIDNHLQPVQGNAHLLGQVINNLVGNAIKYNRDKGKVWVRATDEQAFVRIDVADTGLGIAVDELPHVFERFYRVHSEDQPKINGSGLGLAIAQAVVRKHGGEIWVESVPGEGSTFSFTLPRAGAGQPNEPRFESDHESGEAGKGYPARIERASEQSDAVDDKIQESAESAESDSRSDEV